MKEKNQKKVAGFICILFLVVTVIIGIIAVSPQMLGFRFYTIVQSMLLWITTFASLTICFLYAEAWFSSNHHYFDD
jgi:cobalamin biosynthesis protein CobD/CbiB